MRRRAASGFTLIEIVIVMGILVSLILFLMQATLTSQKLTRDSGERQAARELLYGKMAELRAHLRNGDISGTSDTDKDAQFKAVLQRDSRNGGVTVPADYTGITIGGTTWPVIQVSVVQEESQDIHDVDGDTDTDEIIMTTMTTGYMTIVTFADDATNATTCDEDTANAEFDVRGMATDDTIDIDADLDADDTAVAIAELQVVPVLLRLEWKPGTWQPGDPVSFIEIGGLLY